MKLTIVVVFDKDGIGLAGPCEEREAACKRENPAGRELMRGSDEDQAGLLRELRWDEAVAIDRHRDELGSRGAE